MPRQIALVDCNNFFASCERVFNPRLRGRPLVVLSSNDGCIIARSNEAKALGIPMGQPLHQVRALIERHRVAVFSSNFALYGDMSWRVMSLLARHAPQQEIYSVDESFLDLDGMTDVTAHAARLREEVGRKTGIPVSVGIAASKTLAKLANHCAKRLPPWQSSGVCNFNALAPPALDAVLARLPVGEIWGVGPRLAPRLEAEGLDTVLALKQAPPARLRARYGVLLERIVRELNGEACLALEEVAAPRQQIIASRSLGCKTGDFNELAAAVASHVASACRRLRRQGSAAALLTVFVRTNPFNPHESQHSGSWAVPLAPPSDDLLRLQAAAQQALQQLYRPGFLYSKAGVMLDALQPVQTRQADLFAAPLDPARRQLLSTLEQVQQRFGRQALCSAAELLGQRWQPRHELRSPAYTTDWAQLLQVG